MLCPCGSQKNYSECCKLYIEDNQLPESAEKLMRSRYTAFTQANIEYLKKTLAPESRKDFDPKATKEWAEKSKWKGLRIISTTKGGPSDSKGVVEFMATYELNKEAIDHHEVSDFRKDENGRWFFVDGESHLHKEGEDHHHHHHKPQTVVREQPKIGRNDPCHCGSGKKYKKCHGNE